MTSASLPAWLAERRLSPPALDWDDVVGLATIKDEARAVIERFTAGAEDALFAPGVLLHGSPGSGKTHLARVMAAAAARGSRPAECYELSAAEVDSARLEELRATFAASADHPVLIFVDEVDLWAQPRDSFSHTESTRATLLGFLSLLDGLRAVHGVLWVMATNRSPEQLEPALIRPGRIGLSFALPLPSAEERAALFAYFARGVPAEAIAYDRAAAAIGSLATPAQIRQAVGDAAARAAAVGRPLCWSDLLGVLERSGLVTESDAADPARVRRAALHEAGHAVVAHHLGLKPVNVRIEADRGVTEVDRGRRGKQLPISAEEAMRRMTLAMAGLAAERRLGRGVLLGGGDDLECASEWAIVYLRSGADRRRLAVAVPHLERSRLAADATYRAVDELLRDAQRRAERLVRQHRRQVLILAEVLGRERQLSGTLLIDTLRAGRHRRQRKVPFLSLLGSHFSHASLLRSRSSSAERRRGPR